MKRPTPPITIYDVQTDSVRLSGGQWVPVNKSILNRFPWIAKYRTKP